MRRTLKILFTTAGLVLAFAAFAAAQTTPGPAPTPGAPATVGPNFVDANGDGICDRFQSGQRGAGQGQGRGRRVGDGTHPRPQDGTGFGPGPSAGGGTCDGTGPKGRGMRRGSGAR
jgi:hypothetical protein